MSFQGKNANIEEVCQQWAVQAMADYENSIMRAVAAFWNAVCKRDSNTLAKYGASFM